MRIELRIVCVTWIGLIVAGCGSHSSPATNPSSLNASTEFASPAHGVTLAHPAAWTSSPSDKYVLRLVPPNGRPGEISLDVPELPPHVPGLIPMGLVVKGYIDDLREKHPGIAVAKPVEVKVAGANARSVRSTWDKHVESAVLAVKGDRVFIFRAKSMMGHEADVQAAFDDILRSVKWD